MQNTKQQPQGVLINFAPPDPTTAGSKVEYAYQYIRDCILSNTYPPGTVLYVRELSEQLQVSRTPVKEAINRLAYESYVELYPDRYAVVSRIDYADVIELLELRECLEGSCAYHAALRHTEADLRLIKQTYDEHKSIPFSETRRLADCDMRFHMAIANASYNRQMIRTLQSVFEKFARITLPIQKVEQRHRNTLEQHAAVAEALAAGDPEAAKRLMAEHIVDILTSVKVYQYQNIHLFK